MKNENGNKIILDLCGGRLGNWSRPYKEAGYDVRVVDIILGGDVLTYKAPENVYGILAAPPCTMFTFTRTRAIKPRDLQEGMQVVRACLDIIWKQMEVQQATGLKKCPLQFWAMENPYHGFLKKFLGKPAFTFDPWEFGDGYQKRTALWGYFNEPKKNPVPMTDDVKSSIKGNRVMQLVKFDYLKSKDIHPEHFGELSRTERRSITPAGFAKAFYEANK